MNRRRSRRQSQDRVSPLMTPSSLAAEVAAPEATGPGGEVAVSPTVAAPRVPPVDLDRLEALARGATPGPWFVGEDDDHHCMSRVTVGSRPQQGRHIDERTVVCGTLVQAPPFLHHKGKRWHEDAAFIAAADPATVLALIERVRTAESAAEESALRSIEARNPGIDMAEVRRTRERAAAGGSSPATTSTP